MAGASVQIETAELKVVSERLAKALEASGDGEALLDEIGAYIEYSVQRRFEMEVGPDGRPWKPTRRGGSILKGSPPRLMPSITRRVSRDQVEVGSNVIYAGIHQFGGTIRPKRAKKLRFFGPGGGPIFADQVEIPARPFLGINAEDETEIAAIIENFQAEAFR